MKKQIPRRPGNAWTPRNDNDWRFFSNLLKPVRPNTLPLTLCAAEFYAAGEHCVAAIPIPIPKFRDSGRAVREANSPRDNQHPTGKSSTVTDRPPRSFFAWSLLLIIIYVRLGQVRLGRAPFRILVVAAARAAHLQIIILHSTYSCDNRADT
jgi:hypothetical protein